MEGGKTISRSASSTFHLPPYTQAKRQGCKVFKRMVLKTVLGQVERLESATKRQSIRLSAKQYISHFGILRNLGSGA